MSSVSCDSSGAVSYLPYPLLAGAVCATKHSPICLYAVTEDFAATMATGLLLGRHTLRFLSMLLWRVQRSKASYTLSI